MTSALGSFRSCLKNIRHGLQRKRREITDGETGTVSIDTGRVWWEEVTPSQNYTLWGISLFLRSRLMICSDLLKDRNFIQLIQ